MHRHTTRIVTFAALLLVFAGGANAKKISVELSPGDVTARTLAGRGTYYVVDLVVPEELAERYVDSVVLEFFVDVTPDESIGPEYTPLIEVFPLTEEVRDGQPPRYAKSYPSSRPVPVGEGQRVIIDITEIVRGWIASPATNHGLVLGSFRGPTIGALELREDLVGRDKLALATFYY
jgi:hypothetical protein